MICNFYQNNIEYNNQDIYYTENLSNALFVDFKELAKNQLSIIKKCQRCGRYFVPVNRNAKVYCNLPNVDGSATCRAKGAKEKYTKSLDENEGMALYRKKYQIKDKVVRRNKKDKQLKKEFEQWKKDAKEKVNLFKSNKISERELIEWLDNKKKD